MSKIASDFHYNYDVCFIFPCAYPSPSETLEHFDDIKSDCFQGTSIHVHACTSLVVKCKCVRLCIYACRGVYVIIIILLYSSAGCIVTM